MKPTRLRALIDSMHELRLQAIELEKKRDPDHATSYALAGPATEQAVKRLEKQNGAAFPESYRQFLRLHNGWREFWPSWSLLGTPSKTNHDLYEDVADVHARLRESLAAPDQKRLVEQGRHDRNVVLPSHHIVFGTDCGGSLLLFDRDHRGPGGEPEVVWVQYGHHVQCRWADFEAFLENAIETSKEELAELRREVTSAEVLRTLEIPRHHMPLANRFPTGPVSRGAVKRRPTPRVRAPRKAKPAGSRKRPRR
jgi:hypothetical protein